MTFLLSGPFLALFALAAIPLIVHLVARHRPAPFVFGSLRFLRRAATRVQRRRRPKDLMLLLLRTLAVAALIAAALGPRISLGDGGRDVNDHTVVLVVDRSGSMGAPEGAGTRMAAARERAASVLAASGATRANLVWADARPSCLYPVPGVNLADVAAALRKADARAERADFAAAVRLASDQLAKAKGTRELILVSDFAADDWKDGGPALPPDVPVVRLHAASEEPDNLAVSALRCRPAAPVAGTEGEILCRVSNHGASEARSTLFLELGSARVSRAVGVPAHGSVEVSVPHRFMTPGTLPVRAVLAEDRFPQDNRRQLPVTVADATPFRVEHAAGRPAPAPVARALTAHAWLRADTRGDRADLVWVADWDGADPARLRALAESGAGVVVSPASGCPGSSLAALLDIRGDGLAAPLGPQRSETGWTVAVTRPDHPLFAVFSKGEFGEPVPGRFRQRLAIPAALAADASRVLARFNDGAPALLLRESPRGGSILVWNLAADPALADWTARPAFVVMLGEIAARLPAPVAPDAQETRPGVPVFWTLPAGTDPAQVTLTASDGRPIPVRPRASGEGLRLETETAPAPDLYTWRVDGAPARHAAVNFPADESDLRILREDGASGTAKQGTVVGADDAEGYVRLREGRPVGHWFALAALALFFTELALARLAMKPQPEEGGARG